MKMENQKMHLPKANLKNEQNPPIRLWPQLLLVATSLLSAILTVADLDWEDHVSIRKGLFLFVFGLIFFTCLYNAINIIFLHTVGGRSIIKKFKLTDSDVYDISNKQVSAVQALFCCMTGATSVLYSCPRNMLRTSHYISEGYAWYGAAYFLYDIWSMYKVYSAKISSKINEMANGDLRISESSTKKVLKYLKSNAVIVGHHIFIGAFGFLVITHLRGGLGDCFFGFIYLMEASTPFVSFRGILSKMGMKSSKIYVINGLVMLSSFFICRVAMFPYVLHMYAKSIHLDFMPAMRTLPRGCVISIAILLLPQVYWFLLMLQGATKVLRKTETKKNQ